MMVEPHTLCLRFIYELHVLSELHCLFVDGPAGHPGSCFIGGGDRRQRRRRKQPLADKHPACFDKARRRNTAVQVRNG
jgi:hypothetical protein